MYVIQDKMDGAYLGTDGYRWVSNVGLARYFETKADAKAFKSDNLQHEDFVIVRID